MTDARQARIGRQPQPGLLQDVLGVSRPIATNQARPKPRRITSMQAVQRHRRFRLQFFQSIRHGLASGSEASPAEAPGVENMLKHMRQRL
ncbi:hypothetical protein D3C80_1974010 [compost metagenome]